MNHGQRKYRNRLSQIDPHAGAPFLCECSRDRRVVRVGFKQLIVTTIAVNFIFQMIPVDRLVARERRCDVRNIFWRRPGQSALPRANLACEVVLPAYVVRFPRLIHRLDTSRRFDRVQQRLKIWQDLRLDGVHGENVRRRLARQPRHL